MKFTRYTLKNGKAYTGYPVDTIGSLISLLVVKEDNVFYTSFSKSSLEEAEELREVTPLEREFVENYSIFSKEVGEIEGKIRYLQDAKNSAVEDREKQLVGLYEVASKNLRQGRGLLTVSDFENGLSELGYKNLFILQRYGLLVLGENEEVFYQEVSGKLIPLIEKQGGEVVELLNQTPLNREVANIVLRKLSEKANHETIRKQYQQNEKKEKEPKKNSINLLDIKDKLNEHGFQTLKRLQEKKLLSISGDGTMNFKNLEKVPFINDLLKNPKLLVDSLNQPIPVVSVGLPVQELLKDLEKQFRQFLK